MFKLKESFMVLDRFAIEAEVLNIGNRDIILELSWLMENGFSMDTQDRCQRNVNTGLVICCSVKWIPELFIMEKEQLEDCKMLLIMVARERYSFYV